MMKKRHQRVAVIGAGLAGLRCASMLTNYYDVTIYEKSRGIGGRLATRRTGAFHFDHGAQFFIAKSAPFRDFLEPFIASGDVARWDAGFVELAPEEIQSSRTWTDEFPHYVGQPSMNQLTKAMAASLKVQRRLTVKKITASDGQWLVETVEPHEAEPFDWVVIATPAEQAVPLLPGDFAHIAAVKQVKMSPCYSLMLGFDKPIPLAWQAGLVHTAEISWIAVNHSKPGRPVYPTLLVTSSNAWAEENLLMPEHQVIEQLHNRLETLLGDWVKQAKHIDCHRWRYANVPKQDTDIKAYVDPNLNLAACGDWCIQGRVESAFISGTACAESILQTLK